MGLLDAARHSISLICGSLLHGELRDYWKWVVHHGGVSYRVVYEPDTKTKTVFVLSVGARGEFYERLRRRIG